MNIIFFFLTLFTLAGRCANGKVFSKGFAREENEELAAMDRIIEVNTNKGLHRLFEGDIKLTDEDLEWRHGGNNEKRNAIRERKKIWPSRIIPYEISAELNEHKAAILNAIEDFHKNSCLKFVPRTTETHWIKFVKEHGCWSYIGRAYSSPGSQKLSLGAGCYIKGKVIHELLHSLGFYHEQSRPDRDQYVEIFWENIIEQESHNFNKHGHDYLDVLGVQYDLESIMHYGEKAFSKNTKDTIRAISGAKIGQRDDFSKTDIIKLNSLYNCHLPGVGWSEWSSYSPCSGTCVKWRQRYCFSPKRENCPGVSDHGVKTQFEDCTKEECFAAIDGHWGRWSSWSACSTNCSRGVRTRTRKCSDPTPMYGGKQCPGESKEHMDCVEGTTCNPDNCEFKSGSYCHWMRNTSLDYYWKTLQGPTQSRETGPLGDHTTGSDYYVYAEASIPAKPDDKAVLASKIFPPSQCRCISWQYHMFGNSMGELSVYVRDVGGSRRELWSKSGDQGNKWISADATISNVSTTKYQVEFEAIRGPSFKADIALDDIYFQEVPCGVVRLGCFKDRFARALPDLIANLRRNIDWNDLQKTARECACIAHDKGYKYFAVQFYGECWGSRAMVDYQKYGASDDCSYGVGKDFTNFVYRFKD